MTTAEQYEKWGATVADDGGRVRVQVLDRVVWMTPSEARKLTYELAGAYYRAEAVR